VLSPEPATQQALVAARHRAINIFLKIKNLYAKVFFQKLATSSLC
jgi:hypothetical protein